MRFGSKSIMRITAFCVAAVAVCSRATIASTPVDHEKHVFFFNSDQSVDPLRVGSLLSLQERRELNATGDFDRAFVWQRYSEHLLSAQRTAPFLVLFTDSSCAPSHDQGDDGETEEKDTNGCKEQLAIATKTIAIVTRSLSKAFPVGLDVVQISRGQLPHAFAFHRVQVAPSLIWFPPRTNSQFQRYPHPKTNTLDLSPSALDQLAPPVHGDNDEDAIDTLITRFIHRSYSLSRLSPPSATATGRAQSTSDSDDAMALGILNAIIIGSVLLLVGLAANENREFVLKVMQSRTTWLFLMEGVLYVALSGLLHSVILKVPPFYVHPHFGFYFSHPSGRKQFLFEGLVNGSWSFVISFALFCIVDLSAHVPSRYVRDELFRLGLIAVAMSYMCLYIVFVSKYRWLA